MNKIHQFSLCIFALFAVINIYAQEPTTTQSKKAKAFYQRATLYYRQYDMKNARIEIDNAIDADHNFLEAYLLAAEICNYQSDTEQSINALLTARNIDSTFYPYLDYNLGVSYFECGKYNEAKHYYKLFLNNPKASEKSKIATKKNIEKCDYAISLVNNPVEFSPTPLSKNLELPYEQYWPSLSLDAKTLVFTMLLPDSSRFMPDGSPAMQEDFYVTHFIDGKWQPATPIGAPINTRGNEGAQQISSDGKTLVFTGCNRRDGYGKCDIYFAKKNIYGQWERPYNAGSVINAPSADKQPCLSPDGRFLYFASDRAGGKGKMDIWVSERDANGNWGKPTNLGDPINTAGDDICPFIHPDNQTLYFSSDGHAGLGGKDIFVSRRDSSGNWSKPQNIGYPINTHKDEIGLIVDNSGINAYFSTNSYSETKNLYTFKMPKSARPNAVSYVRGLITDAQTNKPLQAQIQLLDLQNSETIMSTVSDAESGDFLVSLPIGRQYAMFAISSNYLFNSQHFDLSSEHSASEPFLVNIKLEKPQIGANAILNNVFFKFDSFELLPISFTELNRMVQFINNSNGIKFEVGGHTDNVGNDAYNQQLSEKRAKAVYNYLISKGVSTNQLTYKGYGKNVPISDNSTEDGRKQNRRTELKVVE